MSHPSKAWLILICLLSYSFMGQAGCQTTTSQDTMYMRSDMIRIKRDVAEIKEQMGSPVPSANRDVLRNQAKQNEALEELKEGQQRAESRIEEARYEISVLRQEITNLKLNLISQFAAHTQHLATIESVDLNNTNRIVLGPVARDTAPVPNKEV